MNNDLSLKIKRLNIAEFMHCLPFVVANWLNVQRVQGGTHGRILLRACTVYISDSEPVKFGSLPESRRAVQFQQFCLSYNHIKYEFKPFFKLIFDHNYLYNFVCKAFVTKKIHFFHYMILKLSIKPKRSFYINIISLGATLYDV